MKKKYLVKVIARTDYGELVAFQEKYEDIRKASLSYSKKLKYESYSDGLRLGIEVSLEESWNDIL